MSRASGIFLGAKPAGKLLVESKGRWDSAELEGDLSPTSSDLKIKPAVITTAKLQNGAVTTSKLKNAVVTSDKLFVISIPSAKLQLGGISTNQIADGAITGDNILDGNIGTTNIDDYTLTSSNFATNSIARSLAAPNTITSETLGNQVLVNASFADAALRATHFNLYTLTSTQIGDFQITNAKLADGAITAAKVKATPDLVGTALIASSTVLTSNIGNNQVTSTKLVNSSVTTAKLTDSIVTSAMCPQFQPPQITGTISANVQCPTLVSSQESGGTGTLESNAGTLGTVPSGLFMRVASDVKLLGFRATAESASRVGVFARITESPLLDRRIWTWDAWNGGGGITDYKAQYWFTNAAETMTLTSSRLTLTQTTESTSASTGALVLPGGILAAQDVNVGTQVNFTAARLYNGSNVTTFNASGFVMPTAQVFTISGGLSAEQATAATTVATTVSTGSVVANGAVTIGTNVIRGTEITGPLTIPNVSLSVPFQPCCWMSATKFEPFTSNFNVSLVVESTVGEPFLTPYEPTTTGGQRFTKAGVYILTGEAPLISGRYLRLVAGPLLAPFVSMIYNNTTNTQKIPFSKIIIVNDPVATPVYIYGQLGTSYDPFTWTPVVWFVTRIV